MADAHRELGDFLRRARGGLRPEGLALPTDERVRRVPGLRREEVARLAGVSTDYYARLEQGRRIVPSTQVLDALARALELDDAGRRHLHDLVAAAAPGASQSRRAGPPLQRVRRGLRLLLDSLEDQPALVLGHRTDVLASNRLARALFADFGALPAAHRNYARWMLLDEGAASLFVDWEDQARTAVEALRLDAGTRPDDPATQRLVGELSLASPAFRRWWSDHQVHQRTSGAKRLHHPLVGALEVLFETLVLPGDPGQTLFVYTAEPATPSAEALRLLASWSRTPATAPAAPAADR